TAALPDFVKLAEAYQCVGLRAEKPSELDDAIKAMIKVDKPVIFDCRVEKMANYFPMIPSGEAHNNMLLGDTAEEGDIKEAISDKGKVLV
ncbi:MAG TPA: acetolactate synthase 3 large subunit, partial [Rhizobiales bacterium]|nr:acetolactate synthase 3 large subunit [Hyphomicrobiales bacterium]